MKWFYINFYALMDVWNVIDIREDNFAMKVNVEEIEYLMAINVYVQMAIM